MNPAHPTRYRVLAAVSFVHMLNDMMQSVIVAIYPLLKGDFNLSFGLGGIGAAVLGVTADKLGIVFVYQVCAFLPLLGLLAVFLPDVRPPS